MDERKDDVVKTIQGDATLYSLCKQVYGREVTTDLLKQVAQYNEIKYDANSGVAFVKNNQTIYFPNKETLNYTYKNGLTKQQYDILIRLDEQQDQQEEKQNEYYNNASRIKYAPNNELSIGNIDYSIDLSILAIPDEETCNNWSRRIQDSINLFGNNYELLRDILPVEDWMGKDYDSFVDSVIKITENSEKRFGNIIYLKEQLESYIAKVREADENFKWGE